MRERLISSLFALFCSYVLYIDGFLLKNRRLLVYLHELWLWQSVIVIILSYTLIRYRIFIVLKLTRWSFRTKHSSQIHNIVVAVNVYYFFYVNEFLPVSWIKSLMPLLVCIYQHIDTYNFYSQERMSLHAIPYSRQWFCWHWPGFFPLHIF